MVEVRLRLRSDSKPGDRMVVKRSTALSRKGPRGAAVSKPKNLREQVYELMRARIAHGQLTFDDRLVDLDIAANLNISRMPVREALMQLGPLACVAGTAELAQWLKQHG